MLTVDSSLMFSRKSNWSFLLVLIYFLLVLALPVEAQAPTKKNATGKEKTGKTLFESMKSNPWSEITGFRSAKFGMNEKSVYRAIAKDFKIAKSKVKKTINPAEKTTALQIEVPDLFRIGGTAGVVYLLGHKSKDLIHVNVVWGKGAAKNVDGQAVVLTANTLRTHFMKKRYKKKGLVVNAKLSDFSTMIFRGRDRKDRTIVLILNTPRKEEGETPEEATKNVSLLLSYVVDSANPDVLSLQVKEGEF